MIYPLLRLLTLATVLLWNHGAFSQPAADELVIVMHPDSDIDHLDRSQIIHIFMGRHRRLPSGVAAVPIDLAGERQHFYLRLTDKSLAEVNAYWARLIFSGRASPPRQVTEPSDMIDLVASNPGAIGYLRHQDISPRVKAVVGLDTWQPANSAGATP